MGDQAYLVVGSKPWNRQVFDETISRYPGRWEFIGGRDELTAKRLTEMQPRYVFFLHWSWIVPEAITEAFECICFHMTDLPYGRGGTPLQNLIVRGHTETVITAFRMTDELDAGPVYLKKPFSLEGSAREIYNRATEASASMIAKIVAEEPEPVPQTGDVTVFTRRRPVESEITADQGDLRRLHDHIRMLDADGYPPAFLRIGRFRFEFRDSKLDDDRIRAEVEIRREDTEES